ncbi:MAG TPA: hypothetical protein VFX45_12235 [Solirubrobacterales bacterium]|nr:hypothetical protein [Solirubrobacterales bacterium]
MTAEIYSKLEPGASLRTAPVRRGRHLIPLTGCEAPHLAESCRRVVNLQGDHQPERRQKKGLLVNSANICKTPNQAIVKIEDEGAERQGTQHQAEDRYELQEELAAARERRER